ncbi:hypothetical protein N9A68_00280 [Cyclobacteriaceae bacterium]|jgi:hypothetical protein|nr:hypothetical protein [Cyclobacteriaceae bacterium]MDB4314921.1 hypothetical protein [Cyclobacteriaceae bacterium]MDB4742421.1 hypothetical protein [Cyclobacteriaceae bacterium]
MVVKAQMDIQAASGGYLVNTAQFILPIPNEVQDVHVIYAAKNGIVLWVNNFNKFGDAQSAGSLIHLDTALTVYWEKPFLVPLGYTLLGWDHSVDQVQLLFSRKQYEKELFSVFKIDLNTGSSKEQKLSTVFPIEVTHFEALDDFILLGGTTNHKPVVVTFNKSNNPQVVPGIYGNENEIVNISIDDLSGIFSVIMAEKNRTKNLGLTIYGYSRENQQLFKNKGVATRGRNLLNGTVIAPLENSRYLAGSFSNNGTRMSKGLFISKFTGDQLSFLKYYEFAYFEHFFEFMGLGQMQKLKERIKRKTEEGKKINLNYRVIIHEMIQNKEQLILSGEVYYPQHTDVQTFIPSSNTDHIPYSNSGFNSTHAFAVAFDEEGNMLWDHSFPMQDMFFMSLEKKAEFLSVSNRIEVYTLNKNMIRARIFKGQEIVEHELEILVSLGVDSDKWMWKNPEIESVVSWYDQFILALGRQKILSSSNMNSSLKEIFYLNKIHYVGKEDIK